MGKPQNPPEPAPDVLEALGASDADFWHGVVDTMNEGLLLVGPDRRIVYLNKKAEEIVGRSLDDVRGALCVDAISCPQCSCRCRLFEDGRAENVEVQIQAHDGRERVLLKDGRLLHDAHGQVVGGVETFSDITDEAAQREENERYTSMLFQDRCRIDALLGAMDDGILAVNGALRVVMCASRTAEFLGLAGPAYAVDRSLPQLLGVDDDFFGPQQDAALDGRSFRVELTGPQGPRPMELSFRRVRLGDDEMLVLLRPLDRRRVRNGGAKTGQQRIFHGIVSQAPRMREIFQLVENAAQSEANILVEGESGVGKELIAQAIHRLSLRGEQPFYAVNCATFTGSLLLSELFGHERGAFTGAFRSNKGKLEMAGRGTLFLDEVSEIPLHYQAVLLRVLEERYFERVGGHDQIPLQARIIAATNEDLGRAVQQRRFRDDLYFRLKVVPIRVPPLRERPEDIPLLAEHFINHPAVNLEGRRIDFSAAALQALTSYHWPGNVRELRNLIEYLCFVADGLVDVDHLPPELRQGDTRPPPLDDSTDERAQLLQALEQARYRKGEASRLLGIDRTTLWRKMKRLGIS